MLSKNHRLYKAFKEMKNKEKEIQKKKEKISWRGLDSPFIKIEIKLYRDFFEFMMKVLKEEKDLTFKISDLEDLYKDDNSSYWMY